MQVYSWQGESDEIVLENDCREIVLTEYNLFYTKKNRSIFYF